MSGPRGLAVGDPVTSISGCRVTDIEDWHACVTHSIKEESIGHCLSREKISELDATPKNLTDVAKAVDCCNSTSSTHLCFRYHIKSKSQDKYACLPARMTTDRPMCKYQSDCYIPKADMVCVYPALDNVTKLLQVFHGRKPPLLFLGHPLDLHYSVVLSNYVPKSSIIPLNLPYVLETFSKYLISLSGALVILNVVPCYALDGQWICHSFIELSLTSVIPDREIRGLIYSVIILYGTALLLVNVILAMWMLFT